MVNFVEIEQESSEVIEQMARLVIKASVIIYSTVPNVLEKDQDPMTSAKS